MLLRPVPRTLSDLVFYVRDAWGGRPALLSIDRDGKRETLSTSDFLGGIHALALALEARGLRKGDRLALFSENRPEWHVVDLACQLLGVVTVPIYPTVSADAVGFILRNSGARWIVYSDLQKRDLLLRLLGALTRAPTLLSLDDEGVAPQGLALVPLQGEGAVRSQATSLDQLRGRVAPEDLASIIYTSGTTGDPKGVMLTHQNFVSNFLACADLFPVGPDDQALSFLPLSHVFERTCDHFFLYRGVAIHYAQTIDRVPQLLQRLRPTVLTSVPRLYERAYLKVTQTVAKEAPARRRLFSWALRVGQRHATASPGRFVRPFLAAQRLLADRMVYRKIKAQFGGRLRFAIAGGAPLHHEVAEFFEAVGLRVYQGYGLTETAPVVSVNHPRAHRRGSVGRPIPGVDVRIADDGEILVRGPGVMPGYWENPQATAEVSADGWLLTGDIGELDADGFLYITDRKKDLLVTSGGKNVAPQPIEQRLGAQWSIAQAVVAGDNYPYLTALIVPRWGELPEGLDQLPRSQAVRHPRLHEIIQRAVDEVNDRLSEHEQIRRFRLLEHELSEAGGEVTPTLKIRRRAVLDRYAELVDDMYLKTQKVGARR